MIPIYEILEYIAIGEPRETEDSNDFGWGKVSPRGGGSPRAFFIGTTPLSGLGALLLDWPSYFV